MIKLDHINKSFGDKMVLEDISFEVKQGEIVGFLGPNGAGKTTTMRIITGFLSPDTGTVEIKGPSDAENAEPILARIGYLPENNPLYKNMLVSEFLNLSAELKGIPVAKQRAAFDFAVSAVDLAEVYYRPIRELSKGYKQRVGMAAALLAEPDILIMDEPTEGLDPNQRTEIRSLIKKLGETHTIIMSTHVMQEAQAVCSRMLIINEGKIIADGTPESLSKQTATKQEILLEVEGEAIQSSLSALVGVQLANVKRLVGNRYEVRLSTSGSEMLQPEISKLAARHDWIIWKLAAREHSLEDIFHILTSK